jgi:hypothetical protein
MYAKIQKGNSQSYMLIHSNAQISVSPRITVSGNVWDYMFAQEQTKGSCGDDSSSCKEASLALHNLGVEDGTPFLMIMEPNRTYLYGEYEHSPLNDVTVAHVNVDGVSYLTEGKVYILNENGQTIQKI